MHLHYRDTEVVNGRTVRIPISRRLSLLDEDVDAMIVPETLMGPSEFVTYIHNLQLLGNITRRLRQELLEKLDIFQQTRDRLQKSIGGAGYLKNSETSKPLAEVQRKALSQIATAVWGPVKIMESVLDTDGTPTGAMRYVLSQGEQGIKRGIFAADRLTALQLAEYIAPGVLPEAIPDVEYSYDDLCRMGELNLKHLETTEDELKNRHFVCAHIAKMLEIESFEARRVSREGA